MTRYWMLALQPGTGWKYCKAIRKWRLTPPVDNVSKQQPPQEGTNPSPEPPIDPPSLVPTEPIALTALNEQVAVLQENMESIKSGIQPEKLKEINGTIEKINANMNTAEEKIKKQSENQKQNELIYNEFVDNLGNQQEEDQNPGSDSGSGTNNAIEKIISEIKTAEAAYQKDLVDLKSKLMDVENIDMSQVENNFAELDNDVDEFKGSVMDFITQYDGNVSNEQMGIQEELELIQENAISLFMMARFLKYGIAAAMAVAITRIMTAGPNNDEFPY